MAAEAPRARARGGGGSRARERAAPANDTPARRCAARAPPLRRYGFVEFEDSRDADDAVYELNSKELCGERVIVEHARGPRRDRDGYSYGSRSESLPPRAPRPGYLGGGVGGGRGAGAVTGVDRVGPPQPGQARRPGLVGPGCSRGPSTSTHARVVVGHRSAGNGVGWPVDLSLEGVASVGPLWHCYLVLLLKARADCICSMPPCLSVSAF